MGFAVAHVHFDVANKIMAFRLARVSRLYAWATAKLPLPTLRAVAIADEASSDLM
jgi:hypothetical protein